LNQFPLAIEEYFKDNFGKLIEVELLSGLSGAKVYRLSFAATKLVLKSSPNPREAEFYLTYAEMFSQAGVSLPHFYFAHSENSLNWLVLENIPHPLPQERWQADEQVLRVLANLHQIKHPVADAFDFFQPKWTSEMSRVALSKLETASAKKFESRLEELRIEAQSLFKPTNFISGDTNPRNWGVRGEDSPVLFDWERIALGSAAIDVAIVIPGLPAIAAFELFARKYLRLSPNFEANPTNDLPTFIRQLKLAKLWTVIEFLSHNSDNNPDLASASLKIARLFPQWFENLAI
jgi:Phosphotransferase enzyme family